MLIYYFLWTSFIVQRFDFFDIFLTIWHLFDILTSCWHFDIFFNLNHFSLSQGYFLDNCSHRFFGRVGGGGDGELSSLELLYMRLDFQFFSLYLAVIDDSDKFANNGAESLETPHCVSGITLQILIKYW